MTKYFVLRPHALLSSEDSLQKFGEDNTVVIPLAVIDEIQSMKNLKPEKAKVRGAILKYLRYAAKNGALTKKGFQQENGSILRIETNSQDYSVDVQNLTEFQRRTLKVCLGLQNEINEHLKGGEEEKVILITNNTALQIKAQTLNIEAESFRDEIFPELSQQYTGKMEIYVSKEVFNIIYDKGRIDITLIEDFEKYQWYQNCFVILHTSDSQKLFAKVVNGELVEQKNAYNLSLYGVKPLNDAQRIFMCALTSDCPLIIAKGSAGTGKTLLALADSLARKEDGEFRKIYISSPVFNDEIGYLPGDVLDKVGPFVSGIMHNLEFLLSGECSESDLKEETASEKKKSKKSKLSFSGYSSPYEKKPDLKETGIYLFDDGTLQIKPIKSLRGASIMNTCFIVDEAQNIEPKDIKTIITRMGKGSKLVILGDPSQVDHPELNERYNGLVYAAEKMKGSNYCTVVSFDDDDSVRSELAKEAAGIL